MGATVTAYLEQYETWWVQRLATCVCGHCHTPCRRHSSRYRAAWTQFLLRQAERIPVLRVYCPACGATFTLLPDFLTPRQRYQTPVREAVVTHPALPPPCSRPTAARWARAARHVVPHAIQAVTQWLTDHPVGRPPAWLLREPAQGWAGLRRLRQRAEQAGCPAEASGLVGWVNRLFSDNTGWRL